MRVETTVALATAKLIQAQEEIFNVFGEIKVHGLWFEVTTAISNTATTILFNATFATPSVAVQPMSGASGTLATVAQGIRAYSVGGAVATATVITATAGISDIAMEPQIIGGHEFVGTIGQLTAGANATSGAGKFVIYYTPLSDGAYVESLY
jgi:hypothetical protein